MKTVKFRGMPRKKDEYRGKFRGSISRLKPKFRGSARNSTDRLEIPRIGSKFCGPRKTVGPNNEHLS